MRDKFVAFWDVVTKRLSENEYVMGFDPLNEPFPASIYKHPFLIQPHKFDVELLTPLYEEIYKKYETNKPSGIDKNIMYFEPGTLGDIIPMGYKSIVNHLGFASPPGGQNGSDTHVLNEHTYCC